MGRGRTEILDREPEIEPMAARVAAGQRVEHALDAAIHVAGVDEENARHAAAARKKRS